MKKSGLCTVFFRPLAPFLYSGEERAPSPLKKRNRKFPKFDFRTWTVVGTVYRGTCANGTDWMIDIKMQPFLCPHNPLPPLTEIAFPFPCHSASDSKLASFLCVHVCFPAILWLTFPVYCRVPSSFYSSTIFISFSPDFFFPFVLSPPLLNV